jgi:hypothetical protein
VGGNVMTDRKWRIIHTRGEQDFYKKIEKYELKGYILHPESFTFNGWGDRGYFALMSLK